MQFVDPSLPPSQRELMVHCSLCQVPAIIKYRTWKARKRPYRCRSCAMKKARHKVSRGMKRHWRERISSEGQFLPRRNPLSQETKDKISAAMQAHYEDPSNRVIRSISARKDAKKKARKISKAMRQKWLDPEYRRKVTEGNQRNADELWGFKVSLRKRLKQAGGDIE